MSGKRVLAFDLTTLSKKTVYGTETLQENEWVRYPLKILSRYRSKGSSPQFNLAFSVRPW
ncbi:hypothetical protein CY34DRAFT_804182 [Suillus luteus UH-Slu-Lm8-n1]|uniref:Uncharacterized protein n=1 Tax=Suillus luteus UH-Slu-Lm8-n1 TaxID=930992 RepID=A0A0D0AZC3_9AGAM|nr:hypothetical protein CY34DRAFT_804182 [Suillus luteus UH-Slu-Lm8-n1]